MWGLFSGLASSPESSCSGPSFCCCGSTGEPLLWARCCAFLRLLLQDSPPAEASWSSLKLHANQTTLPFFHPCSAGRWFPASFADLPLPQREAVLLGWATGADMRMRKVGVFARQAATGIFFLV